MPDWKSTWFRARFDASSAKGGQARDRAMADNLARAAGEASQAILVVLTGNIHSRTAPGTPWSWDYEPMGFALEVERGPTCQKRFCLAHPHQKTQRQADVGTRLECQWQALQGARLR